MKERPAELQTLEFWRGLGPFMTMSKTGKLVGGIVGGLMFIGYVYIPPLWFFLALLTPFWLLSLTVAYVGYRRRKLSAMNFGEVSLVR